MTDDRPTLDVQAEPRQRTALELAALLDRAAGREPQRPTPEQERVIEAPSAPVSVSPVSARR